MERHTISYYLGILIIFGTHIYLLINPNQTADAMVIHSYANLVAGLLVAYYFMYSKELIRW